jgi:translation elongation factor EF-1alpha
MKDIKLIFIGEEFSGKSTLINKIIFDSIEIDKKSTDINL